MSEKLGLTRLPARPKPFTSTGQVRAKFVIFKDEDHPWWYVLIPTIVRSFSGSRSADWYAFDTFEQARRWVASKL